MFNRIVVQRALKRAWALDNIPGLPRNKISDYQNSFNSFLIHEIFGGEILKTHQKKGWYFYNMIDGKRFDFAIPASLKKVKNIRFEDIPATASETYGYIQSEDYYTFFMRFVRIFEQYVGLEKYGPGYTN